MYRIGIQILSFNRPEYLRNTLKSIIAHKSKDDKICVLEQSDDRNLQDKSIAVCSEFDDIQVIALPQNLGQRGGTNAVFKSGFFNDCKYVMLSDQDNEFFEDFTLLCDKLHSCLTAHIATFYNSPEHDIIDKDEDGWLWKNTARAGHMVLRATDFLKFCPFDLDLGSADYRAGLDWSITHWGKFAPGMHRDKIIAAYPGASEHVGRNSTWQG